MTQLLMRYSRILEIVGDIVKVHVPLSADGVSAICFGDLALIESVEHTGRPPYLSQVILLEGESVSLQVFSGTRALEPVASSFNMNPSSSPPGALPSATAR